jgi:DNA-binding transcriptional LysR family regulator
MVDSFCDVAGVQFMQQLKPFTSKLALRTGLVSPLTQALVNRDLDILITGDPLDQHPQLQRFPLLRDPFVIIVPEKFSRDGSVDIQTLADTLPFIQYNRQSRLGALTDLIARRIDITLHSDYELDSTQTLLRFVQSGHGWSIVTGLCIVRYPELLENIRIMPLATGNHARYLTLLSRPDELGELPRVSAEVCRALYRDEIVPQLISIAPWLGNQAFSITEMPTI